MTKKTTDNAKTPAAASPAPSQPATTATTAGKPTAKTGAATENPPHLPKTWSEIRVGSLVIAEEALEYGWWPAIVMDVHDDILTIRWRDYPKQAWTKRKRNNVAILYTATEA